nr:ABC-three component system middle component 2 [Paradevosia shaoguanensis]
MRRASLVEVVEAPDGIRFVSADDAPAFIKLMGTDYNLDLFARSKWVADQWREAGENFLDRLRASIERWTLEFREEGARSDV